MNTFPISKRASAFHARHGALRILYDNQLLFVPQRSMLALEVDVLTPQLCYIRSFASEERAFVVYCNTAQVDLPATASRYAWVFAKQPLGLTGWTPVTMTAEWSVDEDDDVSVDAPGHLVQLLLEAPDVPRQAQLDYDPWWSGWYDPYWGLNPEQRP